MILEVEDIIVTYLCSESKEAADLRHCFRICKKAGFSHDTAH